MEKGVHILRMSQMKGIERGPGLRGMSLVNREMGAQNLTTGITEFQDGAAIALHSHNCEEQVTIIEGNAVVEIDGAYQDLSTLDTTYVPAGVPHRFLNRSGKIMKILYIYGSNNVTRTFMDTGKTVAHLSSDDRVSAKSK